MLNRLKEKSLILNNYRMNNGISKALGASFKELNEYIEVLSLESNDLSDEALECNIFLILIFSDTSWCERKQKYSYIKHQKE